MCRYAHYELEIGNILRRLPELSLVMEIGEEKREQDIGGSKQSQRDIKVSDDIE